MNKIIGMGIMLGLMISYMLIARFLGRFIVKRWHVSPRTAGNIIAVSAFLLAVYLQIVHNFYGRLSEYMGGPFKYNIRRSLEP